MGGGLLGHGDVAGAAATSRVTAAAEAGAWRSSGASIRAFATAFGPRLGDGLPGRQSKRAVSVPGPGCMGPRLERGTCAPVVASGATGAAGHGSTAGVNKYQVAASDGRHLW